MPRLSQERGGRPRHATEVEHGLEPFDAASTNLKLFSSTCARFFLIHLTGCPGCHVSVASQCPQ